MTESSSDVLDVLVVGYGPVGEAAALLMGHAGLRVEVVEFETDVFHLPRAAACIHETMRVFQEVGVAEQVDAISAIVDGVSYVNAEGQLLGGFKESERKMAGGWSAAYMWYQPEYDRVLREGVKQYPNVTVRLDGRVTHLEEDGEVVNVHVESSDGTKSVRQARFVVGCDGARSLVRTAIGSELVDYGGDEEWLVVDAFIATDDGEQAHVIEYCDPERPTTWVVCEGRHRRWEFLQLPGETREELEAPERVRELIAPWVDPETTEVVRASVYTFHSLIARPYRRNRLFIAGDAAHQTPPFLGQGMVSGVRDVANLVWKMAMVLRGEAADALLDSYEQERRPHFETILSHSAWAMNVVSTIDVDKAAERDRSFAESKERGEMDQLAVHHMIPGLISGVLDPTASSGTGDIFPQRWVIDDGVRVRFDDAAGGGFLFVAPSGFAPDVDQAVLGAITGGGCRPVAVLESPSDFDQAATLAAAGWKVVVDGADDDGGELTAWLEGHGAALVRPDRYVYGTVKAPSDVPGLLAALGAHLGGQRQ